MRVGYYKEFVIVNFDRVPKWILSVLFILFFIFFVPAYSQSCESYNLYPVHNEARKYKNRGNRCEGFYTRKVGAGHIEIVGVILGELQFKLEEDEVIEIFSPIVQDRPLNLRAVGIPIKTYYRMDAKIDAGQKFTWPIKDVIYPSKLSARKIGLFGWVGEERKKKYVPVRAVAKLEKGAKKEAIYMYFRASVKLEDRKWRYSDIINGVPSLLGKWQKTTSLYYREGQPIIVQLPASSTGELFVEVAGRDTKTSKWLKQKAQIIVNKKNEN